MAKHFSLEFEQQLIDYALVYLDEPLVAIAV